MSRLKLRFPEFSGEWEEKKLGEISKIQRGASPRPIKSKKWYDFNNKNVGWVRISDVTRSNRFLYETDDYFSQEGIEKSRFLPKGSLIMSICATIGKPIITGIDTCIHDGFVGFSNLKGINKEFFYYTLSILEDKFRSLGQTGSQANLNSDLVRITKIKIPSYQEQEKIVSFLSKVDEKIGFLEKKRQFWKTYKKGIMQKIFSQELRFKDENGEDYPVWEEKNLSEVSDIKTGNKDLKDKIFDGKYPFFVRSDNIERINSYSYDGEAILIPGDGRIGEVYHYINGKFDYHQRVYKISDFGENSGRYIYYYLKKNFYRQAIKNSVKATVDSLRLPTIKKMPIQLPNLSEQIKIANFLLYVDFKIEKIDKEIETNKVFKNGLMQQMFC